MERITRYEANKKIIEILREKNIIPEELEFIERMNETYKDLRFGQILCNWVYPDYNDYPTESETYNETQDIMNKLFPIKEDPFFEESVDTLKRLNN